MFSSAVVLLQLSRLMYHITLLCMTPNKKNNIIAFFLLIIDKLFFLQILYADIFLQNSRVTVLSLTWNSEGLLLYVQQYEPVPTMGWCLTRDFVIV